MSLPRPPFNGPPLSSPFASPLSIGSIPIDTATALAPMAALTDSIFRRMVKRQGGCGFMVSEMVSAQALTTGCRRSRTLLEFHPEERPIGGQICGSKADVMRDAARMIEDLGFDFVDINMGCPARKVTGGGGGSAMLRDLPATAQVLERVADAVTIPMTVKLRAGWSDDALNAPEAARVAESSGAALVSVHARTRSDQYRPQVREDILAQTRSGVRIPVLANGDIRSPQRALEIVAATGCDGVMIGRGVVANPWLLRAIADGATTETSAERARSWILAHFSLLQDELPERRLLGKLKTFSGWYTRGLLQGAALRGRINELETAQEFVAAVEEFFIAYPTCEVYRAGDAPAPSHQVSRP